MLDLIDLLRLYFTIERAERMRQLPTASLYLITFTNISVLTRSFVPRLNSNLKGSGSDPSLTSPPTLTPQFQVTPS